MVSVDKCIGELCACRSLRRKPIAYTTVQVFINNEPRGTILTPPPAPGMAMAIRAAMVREKHAARTEAMR